MPKGTTLEETVRSYVKGSLVAFIEGGKFARDKKPKSVNWLIGVIRHSGIAAVELPQIVDELKSYPRDSEEGARYDEAKQKVEEMTEK